MLDVRTQDQPFGGAPPLAEPAEPRKRRPADAARAGLHTGGAAGAVSAGEVQTAVWGWLPELALVSSFAVLLLALTNAGAYRGAGWAEPLFWFGLLLIYAPIVVRLTAADAARRERIGLVLLAVVSFYVVKIVHSPHTFTFADELVHAFNADAILRTGALFGPNSVLRASPLYPGLENVTAALVAVSGAPLFAAGLIVAGAARVVLALAVFLCYEQVSGSPRVAGLGAAIYMAQPNFLFWSAQFSYETLSLPLAIAVIYLVAKRREEADPARSRSYLALILLTALALVPTHHLTVYVLVVLLAAWGIVERLALHRWVLRQLDRLAGVWTVRRPRRRTRRARRQAGTAVTLPGQRIGPGLIAAIVLVAALLWLGLVAQSTIGYLSPVFGKAVLSLVQMMAGEQSGRQLFVSTSGTVAPLWERAAGIGSVVVSFVGLPLGLWQLWRRYPVSALAFVLACAAIGFFAVLPLRLNQQAWEIANRASGYLFLGLAFVLALGAAGMGDGTRPRWRVRGAVTAAACLMFVGGVISGWAPALRLARPVVVAAEGRTFAPPTWTMAAWAGAHLAPESVYAADEANGRVLLLETNQRVYAGRYPAIPQLIQDPDIANWVLESLQRRQIRYVVVDKRRAAWDPMAGYFYDPQPGSRGTAPETFDPEQTAKFDRLPVDRVYDAGPIVIYDVKGLRDGPPPR